MADPSQTNLLSFAWIWYKPLAQEILGHWQRLASNISGRSGIRAIDLAAHPAVAIFCQTDRSLSQRKPSPHRDIGAGQVSAGYLVMFAIVFDYSRWISNWAVCMFLILHAVKKLPASQAVRQSRPVIERPTSSAGLVTLIPRVGIVRPF